MVYCSVCNAEISRTHETVAKKGHTPATAAVKENETAATCKDAGSYEEVVYCSVCGKELSRTKIKTAERLTVHNLQNGECTVCGAKKSTEGLEFSLNSDGVSYTVTGIGTCTASDIVIDLYNGMSVTSIGDWAFYYCKSLTSVTIGNGVKSIGYYAFGDCENLTSVYISDIAKWCAISFSNEYSNPLRYAYNLYLNGELVTDLVIPDGVTSIGNLAFYYCKSLTSVTIPDSVTSIGFNAFWGCDKLVEVINKSTLNITAGYIVGSSNGGGVSYYAKEVHTGESKIVNYKNTGYLFYTYNNINYLLGYTGNDKDLILPESYNGENYEIYKYAFCKRNDITSVIIPDSVTSIGSSAFEDCTSLTSVTIGNGVTSIGSSAFYGCTGLKGVYISDIAKWYGISFNINIYSNPLSYAHNLYLNGELVTDIVIPDGVTSIGDYAFSGCTSLTGVTIPNSVTSIGDSAFSGCTSLNYNEYDNAYYLGNESNKYVALIKAKSTDITSCTINENCKVIGTSAFYQCWSLTSITIPDSVMSIGSSAFNGCKSLTSVTIGNGVTSIGYYAFSGCTSLTSVTIGNGVTSIGERAFQYCTSLTSVTIGNGVTSIYNSAFRGCTSLASMTIPDSVKSIGDRVFYECTSLTSVTIGNGVTSIGEWSFYNCESLTSITIPDSVTSIGSGAFDGCTRLTGVYISDIAKWCAISFSDYASNPLYYAHNLYLNGEVVTELVIPNSVTRIGHRAFESCSGLTSITIPDSVKSIGSSAFEDCTSLTSITIPDSVTSIGSYAFSGCTALNYNEYDNAYYIGNENNKYVVLIKAKSKDITSCTINENCKVICGSAFEYCTSLASFYYKGTASEWSNIHISYINTYFTNATRYYYSETEPTETGNYWHYVNGEIVVWGK